MADGLRLEMAVYSLKLRTRSANPNSPCLLRAALCAMGALRATAIPLFITYTIAMWISHCPPVAAGGTPVPTRSLRPGLEWIKWSGGNYCRAGDPTIGVLAVKPERFLFRIFHYAQEGVSGPLTLWEWLERSAALAMFNAGQYYPDYSYMGLLVLGGRPFRSKSHHSFQALFAAEPVDGRPPLARILDLSRDAFDPQKPAYREVAQSFMLLDRFGTIRVRNTLRVANRTVLAEGWEGKIWIFVSQGGYTLWEFGQMLRSSPFPIRQAMAMDGGFEAQMLVKVGVFLYDNLGMWDAMKESGRPGPRVRRPLPTVIGVFPRK